MAREKNAKNAGRPRAAAPSAPAPVASLAPAAAQPTVEQRAANIDGNFVYSEHNARRMQARGPGKHYK